jgi:arylsulfatase A-like enzyme
MSKIAAQWRLWFFLASVLAPIGIRAEPLPNFVFILADDMGWNDAGFCGNKHTDTPHLNRLAREGVVYAQACASAPNCAPTRACLMTGQYAPRHGVFTVVDERHKPGSPHHKVMAAESREALPTECLTLAEALKPAGYATGMFGMWNLGRGRNGPTTPTGQGFDVFTEPKQLGFEKDAYRDAKGAYSPDALTDAALKWVNSVKDRPFFLYLPFHDVHAPFDPKPDLLSKYNSRGGVADPALAATVEAMDANVGRILAALDHMGVAERTFVIFTSDNGGARQGVAPLRGGKGTLYQGGLRVPSVIRGPGIKPGVSQAVTLSMDWFPTVLELAGLKPAETVDGRSLVPLLRDPSSKLERDLFWHFPCYLGGSGPCSAIRNGNWKLIEFFESGTSELYDLAADPGESNDLTSTEPARAKDLLARLRAWQAATGAPRLFSPNPSFDPELTKKRDNHGRDKTRTRKQP